MGGLAGEIGWSRNHLAHRFAIEVGAGPKTVGRILRFVGARRSIDADAQAGRPYRMGDWAGYADQAHLIRRVPRHGGRDARRLPARRHGPLPGAGHPQLTSCAFR
ncbi:MAG TPA: hypothetical protein VFV80_04250 [Geminicoccaceae bacterium]|nr:hypothetical protein [Geminicoccaceae bacterium]